MVGATLRLDPDEVQDADGRALGLLPRDGSRIPRRGCAVRRDSDGQDAEQHEVEPKQACTEVGASGLAWQEQCE